MCVHTYTECTYMYIYGYTYICMTELLCCMPETNITF